MKKIATVMIALLLMQKGPLLAAPSDCEKAMTSSEIKLPEPLPEKPELSATDALRMLHEGIPTLLKERNLTKMAPPWAKAIDNFLWPHIRSESNELAIAILGPANSGKSTFFNLVPSLYLQTQDINKTQPLPILELSTVDFSAGRTARPVLLMSSDVKKNQASLEARFGPLEDWTNSYASTREGNPLAYGLPAFFKNLIFIDTPSMGLRSDGQTLDKVFLSADVLIYVFSGTNYKNDYYLRAVKQKFEEIGPRQVILLYRVSGKISKQEAESHFYEVAREIFPDTPYSAVTKLPMPIIGTYVMTESEKIAAQEDVPAFIPLNNSPEMSALLSNFDNQHSNYRRAALDNTLNYVLDNVAKNINALQQGHEEIELTEKAFELLILQSVSEVSGEIPFQKLNLNFFQKLARWIGRPLAQLKHKKIDKSFSLAVMQQLMDYSDQVIDRTMTNVIQAAAIKRIEINSDSPQLQQFIADVVEFRTAHSLTEFRVPHVEEVGEHRYVIHLSQSGAVGARLQEYLHRDWKLLKEQITQDIRSTFFNLSDQIHDEMQNVAESQAKNQKLGARMAQTIYPILGVAPFFAAMTYIAYSPEASLLESRGILSIVGSMVIANLAVKLEERSVRKAWDNVVNEWYATLPAPSIVDVLLSRIPLQRTPLVKPKSQEAIDNLQIAVEVLSQRPLRKPIANL